MTTNCARIWIVGVAAVFATCYWAKAVPADAAEVLDQQNDVGMSATADSASPFAVETGQTFTVGVAGTLSRIELQINRTFGTGGDAILTVYNTVGGIPNASLGSASLNWTLVPPGTFAYQSFNLSSAAIPVNVGDVLAFAVKGSGDTNFVLRSTFTLNTYAGGESKWRVIGSPTWTTYSPSHDNGFKTYVLAAAVGLPGDYNANQVVDAADFVVWRDNLGAATEASLNGNGDGMDGVDAGDYTRWKANFGATNGAGAGSGSSLAEVPEPVTWVLLIGCAVGLSARRKKLLALDPPPSTQQLKCDSPR